MKLVCITASSVIIVLTMQDGFGSMSLSLEMGFSVIQSGALIMSLQWCHNECDGVSNYRRFLCLLNCLFRRRSKKTSKLHMTGLCEGNSLVTGEFPAKGPVTRKTFPFDDVIMVVQYNMILDASLQWQMQNINQAMSPQKTPHTSPWRVSYGVSFVRMVEKIDHVIMVPHCIWFSLHKYHSSFCQIVWC